MVIASLSYPLRIITKSTVRWTFQLFLKKIFKKDVENYDNIKKTGSNIKVKIATSLILATLLSIFFLITLKFVSSAQEHYVGFDDLQTTQVDSTEEMKKQKEAEEKAKILEAQEKANAARIHLMLNVK
mgnify:CR=1 FL=1